MLDPFAPPTTPVSRRVGRNKKKTAHHLSVAAAEGRRHSGASPLPGTPTTQRALQDATNILGRAQAVLQKIGYQSKGGSGSGSGSGNGAAPTAAVRSSVTNAHREKAKKAAAKAKARAREIAARIEELSIAKASAVEAEDFVEAQRLKQQIAGLTAKLAQAAPTTTAPARAQQHGGGRGNRARSASPGACSSSEEVGEEDGEAAEASGSGEDELEGLTELTAHLGRIGIGSSKGRKTSGSKTSGSKTSGKGSTHGSSVRFSTTTTATRRSPVRAATPDAFFDQADDTCSPLPSSSFSSAVASPPALDDASPLSDDDAPFDASLGASIGATIEASVDASLPCSLTAFDDADVEEEAGETKREARRGDSGRQTKGKVAKAADKKMKAKEEKKKKKKKKNAHKSREATKTKSTRRASYDSTSDEDGDGAGGAGGAVKHGSKHGSLGLKPGQLLKKKHWQGVESYTKEQDDDEALSDSDVRI